MLRESYTAVVARGEHWRGASTTEPYEASWASEAIFFLRALAVDGDLSDVRARVQISADGMHWADEGTEVAMPAKREQVTFCRIRHFGGYLRLAAELPPDTTCQVVASLNLKA